MSAKKALKTLAMGAVLAGVVALIIKMKEEKNRKKAKDVADRAQLVSAKVMKHAQKMGSLTKTAFNRLVDAAVDEYKDVKDVSAQEMKDLKGELKDSWDDVQRIMCCEAEAKPKGKK